MFWVIPHKHTARSQPLSLKVITISDETQKELGKRRPTFRLSACFHGSRGKERKNYSVAGQAWQLRGGTGLGHQLQLTAFVLQAQESLTLSQLHMEPRNGDEKVTWLRYHLGPSQAWMGPASRGSPSLPGLPPTLRCPSLLFRVCLCHRSVSWTGSSPPLYPHTVQLRRHGRSCRMCTAQFKAHHCIRWLKYQVPYG